MILLVSDLHLQPARPVLTEAFLRFLDQHALGAKQLYLLGDIFEYWLGDDAMSEPFNQQIVSALRRVSDAGVQLFWIAGNRDFLVGEQFAAAAGLTLLPETSVIDAYGQRIVLLHGDAQCTQDVKYMAFRAQARQPAWQQQLLSLPLEQRRQIAAGMREQSKAGHAEKSYEIMDVTPEAIAEVFQQTGTSIMIHGHTHRPALHEVAGTRRYVLPDWEPEATPPRGGWISIAESGAITRHALDGSAI